MASTLTAPKSHSFPNFIGKNYQLALDLSIEAILTSLRQADSESSTDFTSELQEFVRCKTDPPLESVWVYAALAFTSRSLPNAEPLDHVLAIKDLFQLIVSCSASCNPVKSIALVAPLIYNLNRFLLDVKGFQLESKKEKKINGEIKSLVDSILGYINVCYDGFDGKFDDSEVLIRPLGDLISFWMGDNGVQNNSVESLRSFFPLLTSNIVERISVEGCGIVDLAGFVTAEAFLLKLCWRIVGEGFGEKMQNQLKSWIVGSVTGFRSSYFYVTLVSMLLEPDLPIASILNLGHEDGVRDVLFQALILVEYSFLCPESLGQLPAKHAKLVIFTKLMATYEAVEFYRKRRDQRKAIPYLKAFANSSLPGLIVKFIRSGLGNDFNNNGPPGGSPPSAYLRWMLNIENRGIKIFDDDMSKFRTAFNWKEESEQLAYREERNQPDPDLLFYIDNKGQEEYGNEGYGQMSESMNAAFMAAAHSMQSLEQGGRKRKIKNGKKKKQIKFVKYNALDNSLLSGERPAAPRNDNSGSGSDLENPASDEDTEMD